MRIILKMTGVAFGVGVVVFTMDLITSLKFLDSSKSRSECVCGGEWCVFEKKRS